jgi:hypothetical protein
VRECDPGAAEVDLTLLEHVSPIEWDNGPDDRTSRSLCVAKPMGQWRTDSAHQKNAGIFMLVRSPESHGPAARLQNRILDQS